MQRVALALSLGLALSACGGDPPAPLDEARTYVIGTLDVPALVGTGSSALATGFDLDDEVSTGEGASCADTPDFLSASEPGVDGVDNALVGVLPDLEMLLPVGERLGPTLQRQILEGDLLLLVEVEDIDSYDDDESVELQLFVGSMPEGMAPVLRGGTLEAGQVFDAVAVGASIEGAIVGGQLIATASTVSLPLPLLPAGVQLVARDVELRARLTPDAMLDGAIGGSFRTAQLTELADAIMPGLGEGLTHVLGPVADLEPQLPSLTMCDAVSFGMSFSAVEAEIAAGRSARP